ncbi:MAG: DegV family protein [Ruminococcaceae bacterium]|nr:DegV family protein [Oscillospiraceae bacterium]
MNDFVIATCSTADISLVELKKRSIDFLKFTYILDGEEHLDDMGASVTYKQFYDAMRNGVDTKTTLPNIEYTKDFLRNHLENGKDVILLMLSSGLSGAVASSKIAVEELREEYPQRKIYVVDSLGASSGMGLLTMEMADRRDAGMSIDELYKWTEENKLKVHHWFFTTDLTYFVKGGRVSKVSGWFGTILKICPLLNVDRNGKLIPREKIRGKASVIKQIVKKMEENAINGYNYNGRCYISHSDAYEDATAVSELIEEKFPNLKGKILINDIGTTIGSHTGPSTVALFFLGEEREN